MQRAGLVTLLLVFAATLAAEDSPLVAAAKSRRNTKPKAKIVITNDNLTKSGGHISTTATQKPIVLPKEDPKPAPQVKTASAKPSQVAKAKAQTPKAEPIDDAERLVDEPNFRDYEPSPKPPIHILPKGMAVDPQTGKKIEEQPKAEKPPEG